VILALVSLLVVFGTPLLHVFYRVLPGFDFSRIDRVIVIYMCAVAVLAGYGFDAAQAHRRRRLSVGIAFIVFALGFATWFRGWGWKMIHGHIAGAVGAQAYLAYASREVYIFLGLALLSGFMLLAAGWHRLPRGAVVVAAVCLLVADLVPNALGFKVSQPADEVVPPSTLIDNLRSDTGTWRFAKFGAEVIPSNTATIVGLDDIHGYDALNVNLYMEVLGAIDGTMIATSNAALRRRIGPISRREALESRILDMLNVKYVMTVADLGGGRPQPLSIPNNGYFPRAYLVANARFFDTYEGMLAYMKAGQFDPAREVLLQGDSAMARQVAHGGAPGSTWLVDHTPHRVLIGAEIKHPCYLVLSDVYYPGWKVFVDDVEVKLLRANYAFRAVEVGPGTHSLRMEYVPFHFRIGLIFSAAGIALVALFISSRRRFG
jgi:hypothetical protein